MWFMWWKNSFFSLGENFLICFSKKHLHRVFGRNRPHRGIFLPNVSDSLLLFCHPNTSPDRWFGLVPTWMQSLGCECLILGFSFLGLLLASWVVHVFFFFATTAELLSQAKSRLKNIQTALQCSEVLQEGWCLGGWRMMVLWCFVNSRAISMKTLQFPVNHFATRTETWSEEIGLTIFNGTTSTFETLPKTLKPQEPVWPTKALAFVFYQKTT